MVFVAKEAGTFAIFPVAVLLLHAHEALALRVAYW